MPLVASASTGSGARGVSKTGAMVSQSSQTSMLITVTEKVIVAVFCAASVAVQVMIVSPTGNMLPDEGVHSEEKTPILSFTEGGA